MDPLDQFIFNAGRWAEKVESLAADVERQYAEVKNADFGKQTDIRVKGNAPANLGASTTGTKDPLAEFSCSWCADRKESTADQGWRMRVVRDGSTERRKPVRGVQGDLFTK